MIRSLRFNVLGPVFALLFACAMAVAGSAAGGTPNIRILPSAAPSLYPAIAWPTPSATPYGNGGAYSVPTPPQSLATAAGTVYVGTVDGDSMFAQMVVTNTYPSTPAPTQTITPNGDEELGMCGQSGSTAGLGFTPSNDFTQTPVSFTKIVVNGVVKNLDPTVECKQYRLPRVIGTNYAATTYNGGTNNGLIYGFAITAPSVSAAVAAAAAPYRQVSNYLGAFARPAGGGPPPFGLFSASSPNTAPSPYPTATATLFGPTGYCDKIAANGYSLASGYLVDATKMSNMVALGVQWSRTGPDPFFDDGTHNPNARYMFADWDSAQCALLRNNINPEVDIEAGPVEYGPSYTQNAIYQSPADFGTWCSAVAAHEAAVFPTVYRFAIPQNEANGGFSDVSKTINPTLYAGNQGIALYSQACYKAIKAVNPNYIVYWGKVNMDPSANPVAYITSMYQYGCRIGACFDAIDIHLSTINDPLAVYDPWNIGYQPSDGETIAAVNAITQAMVYAGETRPIHFMIGESGLYPTVPTVNTMFGNTGDQAFGWSRQLAAMERIPNIDGILIADVDECTEYIGTPFADACVVDASNTPNPSYAVIQPFVGVTPGAAPTLAPGTVPTPSPAPTLTPGPFAPTDIANNVLWMDGTDSLSITQVSGAISQWNDKSPTGLHLTQSVSGNKPQVTTYNGRAAVAFSQTADTYLSNTTAAFTGGTAATVFFGGTFPAQTPGGGGLASVVSIGYNTNDGLGVGLHYGTPTHMAALYDTVVNYESTATVTQNAPAVVGFLTDNGSGVPEYDYNGTLETAASHTMNAPTADTWIGDYPGGGQEVTGTVNVIIVYNRVLTATERQKVEGYIACLEGNNSSLPSGHPYQTSCP